MEPDGQVVSHTREEWREILDMPPLHINCRCTIESLSATELVVIESTIAEYAEKLKSTSPLLFLPAEPIVAEPVKEPVVIPMADLGGKRRLKI